MTSHKTKRKPDDFISESVTNENFLVLHNDDYHTFDYVINSLIEICEHNYEQAVQCTMFVHYKGKCEVRKGSYNVLKPMKDALIGRELSVTID